MGLCSTPQPQDPSTAAIGGLNASNQLQPFNYLVNAAATLGNNITLPGPNGTNQTYDFSGLGQAQTAGVISDQMAQTLLDLQKENSPTIIAQRIAELKAADPQGYAARQQLFDAIQQQANNAPGRPISQDLQNQIQGELSQGANFADPKMAEQVREQVRGGQSHNGIFLGNAPTSQEAQSMVNAGEQLQSQRQQNAVQLLQSGVSPQDIAYHQYQQNLANYANFTSGQTPTAQFQQVANAGQGPVNLVGGAPSTAFNPNAAGIGLNAASGIYSGQLSSALGQANPWLAGASSAFGTVGTLNNMGAFSPGGLFGPSVGAYGTSPNVAGSAPYVYSGIDAYGLNGLTGGGGAVDFTGSGGG